MGTTDSEIAFLREGLLRYPGARETVQYFERHVLDAIFSAFETRANWKHFQPVRKKGSLEFGKGMGNVFINAWIVGAVPTRNLPKVFLGLGLHWTLPLVKGTANAVAACNCNASIDGVNRPVPFNRLESRQGITLAPVYRRSEEPRLTRHPRRRNGGFRAHR
jgi:hypothetical protein